MPTSDSKGIEENEVQVSPINRIKGELRLPGDKSISHRAALLASLAHGQSTLKNFSTAQDCGATIACLEALGVRISGGGSTVIINGSGSLGLRQPARTLDAQNSGTTMRLLAGVLAGQPFSTTISGDDSLRARPMLRVAEPLRLMGAEVEVSASGGAPLSIVGHRPLKAISYQLPIASAQIKTAILLAGLAADGLTTIAEPHPTRDHTERMLPEFGAPVTRTGRTIAIQGGLELKAHDCVIPGDISSAAFFIAAAVAVDGSELVIRDVGLNPNRTTFLSQLREVGAQIDVLDERIESGEPVGTLHVHGIKLNTPPTLHISGSVVPNLIDELPLLAFLIASLGGEMKLSDAKELRVKESNRIAATVENLGRMGARIEARPDGWHLQHGNKLHGANLSSFGDHRIAMAGAMGALAAIGPSTIEDAREAVAVSLPEFWTLLRSVIE